MYRRLQTRRFILLQILIVGGRQPLQGGQQPGQQPGQRAALAAGQFQQIRVFLLRHQAGTGGEFIRHADKTELDGGIQDERFRHPAEVHPGQGGPEKEFNREITVRDGIQ